MVKSVNIVASEKMVASGNINAGGYNTDRVTVQGLVKSYLNNINHLVWDKHQSLLMLLLYVIMTYMLISMITFFM